MEAANAIAPPPCCWLSVGEGTWKAGRRDDGDEAQMEGEARAAALEKGAESRGGRDNGERRRREGTQQRRPEWRWKAATKPYQKGTMAETVYWEMGGGAIGVKTKVAGVISGEGWRRQLFYYCDKRLRGGRDREDIKGRRWSMEMEIDRRRTVVIGDGEETGGREKKTRDWAIERRRWRREGKEFGLLIK